jgi:putative FmdB family regulatory protein
MPIYEFICEHCELRFEELVRNGDKPRCPECSTSDIRRMLSSFAVHSTSANLGGGRSKNCGSCGSSSCGTCH